MVPVTSVLWVFETPRDNYNVYIIFHVHINPISCHCMGTRTHYAKCLWTPNWCHLAFPRAAPLRAPSGTGTRSCPRPPSPPPRACVACQRRAAKAPSPREGAARVGARRRRRCARPLRAPPETGGGARAKRHAPGRAGGGCDATPTAGRQRAQRCPYATAGRGCSGESGWRRRAAAAAAPASVQGTGRGAQAGRPERAATRCARGY